MPRLAVEAKEAKREHILRAALRCFARSGYHLTTVDDIAAEAGVSKGAPYVYFDGKEALFQALHSAWDCGLTDRIDSELARLGPQARSPRRALEAVLAAVGAHVSEEADLCRVLIEARTQAAYVGGVTDIVLASQTDARTRMRQLIEAGIACGEWPPDTDSDVQARLILAAVHGLMAEWHLRPGSFSWQAMATALSDRMSGSGEQVDCNAPLGGET